MQARYVDQVQKICHVIEYVRGGQKLLKAVNLAMVVSMGSPMGRWPSEIEKRQHSLSGLEMYMIILGPDFVLLHLQV